VVPARPSLTRESEPRMLDYDDVRKTFQVDVPEYFNPVSDILGAWAAEQPDAPALRSVAATGAVMSHSVGELLYGSLRAAQALADLGVERGQTVFVMLPRGTAWYLALLGAIRIGAIAMPAPNLLTSRDIAYRLQRGESSTVIVSADAVAKVDAICDGDSAIVHRICSVGDGEPAAGWLSFEELCAAADPEAVEAPRSRAEDPMLLFFTSGTTGGPKMVLHSMSHALGHVATARFWHDLRAGDRHWTVTDTGWAKAAWGGLFGQWHERAEVMQVDLVRPEADAVLRLLAEHEVTSFCAPPTLYRTLVQADLRAYDLATLRHCTSAGEPLNPQVLRAWAEGTGGLTIFDGYGQTETTLAVANFRALPVRPGSMGKPVPGYTVDVIDDEGSPAGVDELGDIAIHRNPPPVGLFLRYHRDGAATRSRMRQEWYLTGDRGRRDADGYIWFEGRDDDIITSSAYRIGPFEVESALLEHPAIVEAGVVGKPDPERTEIVCAFVILAEGWEPSDDLARELQDHVKRVTAPYKYPREIVYVNELPKTVSGKIRRNELRASLSRVHAPGGD
jgi:acetyl-CoA synthetase